MIGWLSDWWGGGGTAVVEPATARDAVRLAQLHGASFHRGLSRNLLLTHLGHLAGRGVRTIFLEVEENNQPARRLYERMGFAIVGRRERYYRQAGGEQLNALLMRRDLS
jgi:ribosomal-protein-alanine N-acetyltransferase